MASLTFAVAFTWTFVTLLLCICSYYLGAIQAWKKASKYLADLIAQISDEKLNDETAN